MIKEYSVRAPENPNSCSIILISISKTGGVVVTQDFLEVHDLVGPSKTSTLSTVTAIYDIGCFFGAIIAFTFGERLGRKKSILLGTVIMSVGTILQSSSFSLPQMFVGRVILGRVYLFTCYVKILTLTLVLEMV